MNDKYLVNSYIIFDKNFDAQELLKNKYVLGNYIDYLIIDANIECDIELNAISVANLTMMAGYCSYPTQIFNYVVREQFKIKIID